MQQTTQTATRKCNACEACNVCGHKSIHEAAKTHRKEKLKTQIEFKTVAVFENLSMSTYHDILQ